MPLLTKLSLYKLNVLVNCSKSYSFKDIHREKTPSNKTPALTKSMNMDNWVVGTSNQLFIRGPYNETKSSKKIK